MSNKLHPDSSFHLSLVLSNFSIKLPIRLSQNKTLIKVYQTFSVWE